MFGRKKRKQEEAQAIERAQKSALAQQQMQTQAQQRKAQSQVPRIEFKIMNNCYPIPVARPADFIQLTPAVQPLPVVPYHSDEAVSYNDPYAGQGYYDEMQY
ncbi:MAG: hypothetical protein FWD49_02085 [Firmicutes bacterium]|nr:hypothetical protein [Bacillota bacterium]